MLVKPVGSGKRTLVNSRQFEGVIDNYIPTRTTVQIAYIVGLNLRWLHQEPGIMTLRVVGEARLTMSSKWN